MTKKKEVINLENTVPVVFYKRGDEFEFRGKRVKVVEVIEEGRLHVKNQNEPFDSFIVLEDEIGLDKSAPDLLCRPDDRISL